MTHKGLGRLFALVMIAVCSGKSSYPVPLASIVILYCRLNCSLSFGHYMVECPNFEQSLILNTAFC